MSKIDAMINFGLAKKGLVKYSMNWTKRLGPYFYDCSSFVLACAISAGLAPESAVKGNTETLYAMNNSYLQEIYSYKDVKKGDIFILGAQGASSGAAGHTGIFLGNDKILHCSYSKNGVSIDKAGSVLSKKRSHKERYFRFKKAGASPQEINKNMIDVPNLKFIKNEKHTVTIDRYISSRSLPSLRSKPYKHLKPGDRYTYTKVYEADGFRWLYYKNSKGKEMFLPYRHVSTPKINYVKF